MSKDRFFDKYFFLGLFYLMVYMCAVIIIIIICTYVLTLFC